MQIKQSMLAQLVQKKIAALYMIIGQDNYLLNDSLFTIKSAISKKYNCDEKIIPINSAEDWNNVHEEANSYSLFSEFVLLNIFYDKKTIDNIGKKVLSEYLNSINSRCFIVIRAPNVSAKQLSWFSSHENAVLTLAYPLNGDAVKSWIMMQLKNNLISYDAQIPDLIYQYTQGNMLACSQVLEKIKLSCTGPCKINSPEVLEHLSNQCEHNLFELVEACLLGQSDRAIQILRHAADNAEATLVLWILCQEIRLIMQLFHLMKRKMDFQNACTQLKIWPQRISMYKKCLNRLNEVILQQLHRSCYSIEEKIKSNHATQVWGSLENVVLSFCLGKAIGDTCTV